jgi:hypothetical protein
VALAVCTWAALSVMRLRRNVRRERRSGVAGKGTGADRRLSQLCLRGAGCVRGGDGKYGEEVQIKYRWGRNRRMR